MASNEQQFRESLRSFSWAANTTTQTTLNNSNNNNNASPFSRLTVNTSSFFGSIGNRVQGYLPLNNAEVEEPWYALNRWQRFAGFGIFFAAGAFLFLIAFLTLPLLAIKPRKFAATYTMGSVMIIISFALLHSPMAYLKHVTSRERLPFSIAYFGSLIATLYFAIGLKSAILTLIFCIIQIVALLWYLVSYFPGGSDTLQFGSRMLARQASGILSI